MSAAVQCDGCKRFQVTENGNLSGYPPVVLPDTWLRLVIASSDRQVASFEWHICSLPCAVAVTARVADRGELP